MLIQNPTDCNWRQSSYEESLRPLTPRYPSLRAALLLFWKMKNVLSFFKQQYDCVQANGITVCWNSVLVLLILSGRTPCLERQHVCTLNDKACDERQSPATSHCSSYESRRSQILRKVLQRTTKNIENMSESQLASSVNHTFNLTFNLMKNLN